jgi:hypothetical protein
VSKHEDFILIFETPDPAISLAITFWSDPDEMSEPYEMETKHVRGVINVFQRKGYEAYKDKATDGISFLLVHKGYSHAKANDRAQVFMKTFAMTLLRELLGGTDKVQ